MNLVLWVLALASSAVMAICPAGMLLCVEEGGRIDVEPAGATCCRAASVHGDAGSVSRQGCPGCDDHELGAPAFGAVRTAARVKAPSAGGMELRGACSPGPAGSAVRSLVPAGPASLRQPTLTGVVLLV